MPANRFPSRNIAKRIFIKGNLKLLTPAVLGGGKADGYTDMTLIRDPLKDLPLLTGTSLAGALQDYLRARKYGFFKDGKEQDDTPWQELLFGEANINEQAGDNTLQNEIYIEAPSSNESWLIISDSLSDSTTVEVRDNVGLDSTRGTVKMAESQSQDASDAKGGAKFDYEALAQGAIFPLRLELLLPEDCDTADQLKRATAIALEGLERAEIRLGAKKSRGFGKCQVETWQFWEMDLKTKEGMDGWITWDWKRNDGSTESIANLLDVDDGVDERQLAEISASFKIRDALLIRSATGEPNDPDIKYLVSERDGSMVPILSGTSLAGAMRSRCERILNTLDPDKTEAFITRLFGTAKDDSDAHASRLLVEESIIDLQGLTTDRIQSRLKIDRFTGSAYPAALFDESPLFAKDSGVVQLKIEIKEPMDEEIGLLLFMLKDLWLGDLMIGGESGIGRGALKGLNIKIEVGEEWCEICQAENDQLVLTEPNPSFTVKRFENAFVEREKWTL